VVEVADGDRGMVTRETVHDGSAVSGNGLGQAHGSGPPHREDGILGNADQDTAENRPARRVDRGEESLWGAFIRTWR